MNKKFHMDTPNDCPDTVDRGPRTVIRSMAMSAHDLKNLLTAILLLAERIALESRPLQSGIETLAHRILEGGKRMQQSLNNLMETAAGEIQDSPFQRKRCNLTSLLRHVVKSNWEYALSKDIRLRCPDLGVGECWAQVDEECLRMAVENLVNNAIKFSRRGSEVQVTLFSHEGEGEPFASIRVKDQGPGLTPEDKAKAFGPFQTLSAKPTAGESSTGLGLSIVRQLVERHGGKVWIESVHGQGATFCIDLPLPASPEWNSNGFMREMPSGGGSVDTLADEITGFTLRGLRPGAQASTQHLNVQRTS